MPHHRPRNYIPETIFRPDPRRPVEQAPPHVDHYVFSFWDIANVGYINVPVDADVLRIRSDFPVIVILDGVPVNSWRLHMTDRLAPEWTPATSPDASTYIQPAFSYVIRQHVRLLTLAVLGTGTTSSIPDSTGDWSNKDLEGQIHVFAGRAVEDVDFGLPISFAMQGLDAPGGVQAIMNFLPTLHGNDTTSPTDGRRYIPTRIAITALTLRVSRAAGAFDVNRVTLGLQSKSGNVRPLGFWPGPPQTLNGAATVAFVSCPIGDPIVFANLSSRFHNAGPQTDQLRLVVDASAAMDAVEAGLTCLAWM